MPTQRVLNLIFQVRWTWVIITHRRVPVGKKERSEKFENRPP